MLYKDDKSGPFAAAAYTMIMLGCTADRQYSRREVTRMLDDAGFRQIQIKPTFGYMSVVTGIKT